MERHGRESPAGSSWLNRHDEVTWLDRIIVSADPVAADAYATTLFGKKSGDIAYIGAAAAHNLGVADLDRNDVIKLG